MKQVNYSYVIVNLLYIGLVLLVVVPSFGFEGQAGLVPLVVPITLLNHHFRRHPDDYVSRQHYLAPHPRELMLRNHV